MSEQTKCYFCGAWAHAWPDYSCRDLGTEHRFATPEELKWLDLGRRLASLRWAEREIEQVSLTLGEDRGVLEFDRLEVKCITLQKEIARVAGRFAAHLAELSEEKP